MFSKLVCIILYLCSQGYVSYGWQFPGEEISIPSEQVCRINSLVSSTKNRKLWDYDRAEHRSRVSAGVFCKTLLQDSKRISSYIG